jgi:hypothetical protein
MHELSEPGGRIVTYQDRLEAAVELLRRAVESWDAGEDRSHAARLARHREQWPELWEAIDLLLVRP